MTEDELVNLIKFEIARSKGIPWAMVTNEQVKECMDEQADKTMDTQEDKQRLRASGTGNECD